MRAWHPAVHQADLSRCQDELAFLAGVGVLAAAGVIEWPVAGLLGLGHLLAAQRSSKALRDFGEALEEA